MPRLLIENSRGSAQVFELLPDHPISIGRAKSSNLVLDDASISRLHAVIRSTPEGQWEIVDRSSNGLKVNGRVVKEAKLQPNDDITIGEFTLRFEEPDVRSVSTHDTAELPPSVMREISTQGYYGSFLPPTPVVSPAAPDAGLTDRMRSLERENRLLTILYRVTRALAELKTIEEITDRVLDLVLEIEGAQRGYAMLLNEASIQQTDFKKGDYGFQPALIRYRQPPRDWALQRMPNLIISKSIVRNVMQAGAPLLIADAKGDPRLAIAQSVVDSGIQSAMCAPLVAGDRRYGLLYVDNLNRKAIFSMDELNVFAVIAAQAGFAIDRAHSSQVTA